MVLGRVFHRIISVSKYNSSSVDVTLGSSTTLTLSTDELIGLVDGTTILLLLLLSNLVVVVGTTFCSVFGFHRIVP